MFFTPKALRAWPKPLFMANFRLFSVRCTPAPTLFVQRLRMLIRSVRLPVRTLRFYIRALRTEMHTLIVQLFSVHRTALEYIPNSFPLYIHLHSSALRVRTAHAATLPKTENQFSRTTENLNRKRNNARETAMNTGAIRGKRFRYGLKQAAVRHFSGTSANIFAVHDMFFFIYFCKKKKKRIFGNV